MANPILKAVKKFIPIWQEAKEKDLKEADVVTRIIKFLEEGLGYDVLKHITKEFQIKERFVDLAIKADNKVAFYIEAKSANTILKEAHIFQAESYASQSGVNWVVLTNGSEWHLYRLIFEKTGIGRTLVFSLDMINGDVNDIAEKLYCLSYDAIRKNELEEYWEEHSALQPSNLIKALFHEDTIMMIRRNLRKKTDMMVNEEKVLESMQNLLKSDIVAKYKEQIRIWRAYKKNTNKNKTEETNTNNEMPTQQVQEPQVAQQPAQTSEVKDSTEQKPT
jgi:predicted type IV restriction endonuclease